MIIDVMTEDRHAHYVAWKTADQISKMAAIWADRLQIPAPPDPLEDLRRKNEEIGRKIAEVGRFIDQAGSSWADEPPPPHLDLRNMPDSVTLGPPSEHSRQVEREERQADREAIRALLPRLHTTGPSGNPPQDGPDFVALGSRSTYIDEEPEPDLQVAELRDLLREWAMHGDQYTRDELPPVGIIIGFPHSLWVLDDVSVDIAGRHVEAYLRHYYVTDRHRSISVRM